jgi:(p)ppGpp synthase/HD superfamily hydrolase
VTRTVNDARELAYAVHEGHVDKAGAPYFEHVAEVARRLEQHGDEAVMAGYLHDAVEDTALTLEWLLTMGFPEAVVRAVDAVTLRDGEALHGHGHAGGCGPAGTARQTSRQCHELRPGAAGAT